MDENIKASWERVLHPETLRTNIITASVFIVAYEMLLESIIGKIRDFYSIGFDQDGWKVSPDYKHRVLSLDEKGNPLKASLAWLKESQAISDADIKSFEYIKKCRNTLAHGMLKFASSGVDFDLQQVFNDLVNLIRKVELWWFENLEMSIDPEAYPEDLDINTVTPGAIWSLQLLIDVALGPPEKAAYYYDEFVKNS